MPDKQKPDHRWIDNLALIMGIIGQLPPFFQAYKIISLKSAHAVSLEAQLIGLMSVTCWLLYGYVKNINPLLFSSIVGLLGLSLVLLGMWLYW